jgi:hypothetical protein
MRPLKGIVTETAGGWMKIHLAAGNIITTPKVEGMRRGTRVEVFYDFTHNRVREIRFEGEKNERPILLDEDELNDLPLDVPPDEVLHPVLSEPMIGDEGEEEEWE